MMKSGISATLIAIPGSRPSSSGVIAAPTATPSTVRIAAETPGGAASGACRSAATRQANIGPSSHGSGSPSTLKTPTPTSERPSVAAIVAASPIRTAT